MSDTELHEEAVASPKLRRKFWPATAVYLGANSLLSLIWIPTGRTTDNSIPRPARVSIIWGFSWRSMRSRLLSLHDAPCPETAPAAGV